MGKRELKWAEFVEEIRRKFGEKTTGDVIGEFNKLKQLGSFEYQRKF